MNLLHYVTFGNLLWSVIGGAWLYVLVLGLEADKPLSGDLPGTPPHPIETQQYNAWNDDDWDAGDYTGETAAWTLFGAMGMLLFFLLYWMVSMHGYLW
jgi:hypothetical protein